MMESKQTAQSPFDMASCMAMMQKMMSQAGEGCDCSKMMSQFKSMEDVPDEWAKVMSQMAELCCGSQAA